MYALFDIDNFCLPYYLQKTTFQYIFFPTPIVHVYHCCRYRYNEEYNYSNNSSNDSTGVFRSAFISWTSILVFIDSRCYSIYEIKNMIKLLYWRLNHNIHTNFTIYCLYLKLYVLLRILIFNDFTYHERFFLLI